MASRVFAVLVLLLSLSGFDSRAQAQSDAASPSQLGPADQDAIRHVVEAQLAAFQRDDGAAAFGFASPDLQLKFRDAANFMAMVKTGYPAVYRPKSVAFDKLQDTKLGPDQVLRVIGPDGVAYTAHYIMERQPDGTWMINGCYLSKGTDESV
jgi:hypothetical protein